MDGKKILKAKSSFLYETFTNFVSGLDWQKFNAAKDEAGLLIYSNLCKNADENRLGIELQPVNEDYTT